MGYTNKVWQAGDIILAEDLNHIENGIADVYDEKADRNEVSALSTDIDVQRTGLSEVREELTDVHSSMDALENRVDVKADHYEVEIVATELDKTKADLAALDDRVLMKAETHELGAVAGELAAVSARLDQARLDFDELSNYTIPAITSDIAAANVTVDELGTSVDRLYAEKMNITNINAAGQLAAAIDMLEWTASSHASSIQDLATNIGDVAQSVNARVPKPVTNPNGTAGQVLGTNGSGATYWTDPTVPTDEQIGTAVSNWLTDHPEATTTVEDGSITEEKLSADVRNTIENGGGGGDAQVMNNELIMGLQRLEIINKAAADQADYYNSYKEKLIEFSSYFAASDGIGFLSFTDPHNMAPRSNAGAFPFDTPQYVGLTDLHYIRGIYENTPAKWVLCGGDWINSSTTLDEAMMMVGRIPNIIRTEICPEAYTVAGNHDTNEDSGLGRMSSAQLAKLWFDKNIGYYILESTDCACYMLDASWSISSLSDYQWQEIDWVANKLLENTKPHLFGVGHIIGFGSGPYLADALCSLLDAFNQKTSVILHGNTYDFTHATGTWHFCLTGHYHNDTNTTINHIPIIFTRDFGTDRSVDCCYADFGNAVLHMVRIGAGESRDLPIIPNNGYQTN